jgi:hypothetical protein
VRTDVHQAESFRRTASIGCQLEQREPVVLGAPSQEDGNSVDAQLIGYRGERLAQENFQIQHRIELSGELEDGIEIEDLLFEALVGLGETTDLILHHPLEKIDRFLNPLSHPDVR